jgi:hypothetical protein
VSSDSSYFVFSSLIFAYFQNQGPIIRKVLEQIREAQGEDRGTWSFPATSEAGAKAAPSKHEMI